MFYPDFTVFITEVFYPEFTVFIIEVFYPDLFLLAFKFLVCCLRGVSFGVLPGKKNLRRMSSDR